MVAPIYNTPAVRYGMPWMADYQFVESAADWYWSDANRLWALLVLWNREAPETAGSCGT